VQLKPSVRVVETLREGNPDVSVALALIKAGIGK